MLSPPASEAENPLKKRVERVEQSKGEKNSQGYHRRKSKNGSGRSAHVVPQDVVVASALRLMEQGHLIEIEFDKEGTLRRMVNHGKRPLPRPPGLTHLPPSSSRNEHGVSSLANPSMMADASHQHVASEFFSPHGGESGANRKQHLTRTPAVPPAAVAQDASGAGPSTIATSTPDVTLEKVHQVKEVAGVDTPVAVSALKETGGDANAASDNLLEAHQKSEARERAQRAQKSIEEAANNNGKSPSPDDAQAASAGRQTQKPSEAEKQHQEQPKNPKAAGGNKQKGRGGKSGKG